MVDWASVATEFTPDGSLHDIYVFDTTVDDWQAVIDAFRATDRSLKFFVNGDLAEMPERVVDVFAMRQLTTPSLHIGSANISMNCHFFAEDEIEFDLDPREIFGPEQLDCIVQFMTVLTTSTQKAAVLTHENSPAEIILTVSASFGSGRVGGD